METLGVANDPLKSLGLKLYLSPKAGEKPDENEAEKDVFEETVEAVRKHAVGASQDTKKPAESAAPQSEEEDYDERGQRSLSSLLGQDNSPRHDERSGQAANKDNSPKHDERSGQAANKVMTREDVEQSVTTKEMMKVLAQAHARPEPEEDMDMDDLMADLMADTVAAEDYGTEDGDQKGEQRVKRFSKLVPMSLTERNADGTKRGYWWSRKIGHSKVFAVLCLGGIVLNAILTGFFVDAKAAHEKGELDSLEGYVIAESCFLGWFTFELMIRVLNHRNVLKDPVMLFDMVVIIIPAVEVYILLPLDMDSGVSFIGLFRILRLVRGVNVIKRLPSFRPLYLIIMGVSQSGSLLLCLLVLLGCMIGTVSLMLTLLIGPSTRAFDELPPWIAARFQTFGFAYVTLYEALLGGIEWAPALVEPLLENRKSAAAGIILCAFVVFANIIILNLAAGIFVYQIDMTTEALESSSSRDESVVTEVVRGLLQSFEKMDTDKNGTLSWEEFSVGVMQQAGTLQDLGMGIQEAKATFHDLDHDDSNSVSIHEFISGIEESFVNKKLEVMIFEHQQKKALKALKSNTLTVRKESVQIVADIATQRRRADRTAGYMRDVHENLQKRLARHKLLVDTKSAEQPGESWQDVQIRLTSSPKATPRALRRRSDNIMVNVW
eukprot:CAMPEP_0197660164 /NCGR_PEP_ID=MMETSP1338-20131121/50681_1 /TAXON_ID=43686 ORGANISM="Pelagodinium beii, Strain RCC1491" /NCGR_SAMPLE_ID=MMETSP1338 /ASSEMBLY_ACC=CAM_ASM_000754 /LENGTH=663 /DNA_ID=CAMNT_0043237459 /DNA_START=73 /DNA_END=2061 /DNA_ORIENTATION=-